MVYSSNELPTSCQILGVSISVLSVPVLHDLIATYIRRDQKALVLNVNVNCLNLAYTRPWLRKLLNQAEIVFCDGAGAILGARILGYHIPERITYADWMWKLAEFVEQQGFTLFFLGARPGVAEKAARQLREQFSALQIVGIKHGYFDKTHGSSENEAVVREINAVKPNILIVGFGMPLEECWLMENCGF
jgi:N-acetylglucosaminyldiphosphoundecaprenol N-acetyl-beta-D-mannosaminyltransferase